MIYYVKIDEKRIIQSFKDYEHDGSLKIDSSLSVFEILGARLNDDGSITQVPKVPQSVTMRQARRAMIDAKIYDKVDAAIKSMGGKALVDWEYSNSFERNNPMLEQLGETLGLTEKQIDELFITAAKESLP